MLEFLRTPLARAVIYVAILLVLMIVGYYLVRRFRGQTDDDGLTASELMTNFREMHDGGAISEKEFRTIKTKLNEQLQNEVDEPESSDSVEKD